ncbi:MAG: Xaa-Pro peptidase family protein [Chloroflexota bacterium]|nr:Xaa-Pro peptidase family protein [Chloroflexota bacterium]
MLVNRERAHVLMRESGLDAIIATSPENVAYVADYYCLSHWCNKGTLVFAVLPADNTISPCLITLALEFTAWAETPSWIVDVRVYGTSYDEIGIRRTRAPLVPEDEMIVQACMSSSRLPGWRDVLIKSLADRGLLRGRLGLDGSGLSHVMWKEIVSGLPRAAFIEAADLLRQVRMVKSPQEIERLRRSSEITEQALADTMSEVQPGVSERELAHRYNSRVAELGGIPALTLITGGRRSGHPHALTSDYVLQVGDMVKFDLGCRYSLYWSDTARAMVVNDATDRQIKVHQALLAGEQAALQAIRPGIKPSELFDLAVETVRDSGIPDYQRHHVGHGIGIELYDHPLLQSAAAQSELSGLGNMDVPLEPGMVLNIECPYYVIGEWGLNIEDTVVVTATGIDSLTHLDKDL